MGFFSREDDSQNQRMTDEQAVERYRYMLRTAPPETLERAHEEAFARLTPEQRRLALQQLSSAAPPEERRYASDDPKSLARLATRTELRQPGMLERLFGGSRMGGGMGGLGLGGMFAGSLLASLAGTFIGSSIAHSFFDAHPFDSSSAGADDHAASFDSEGAQQADYVDPGLDEGMDTDFDGGDFGEFA